MKYNEEIQLIIKECCKRLLFMLYNVAVLKIYFFLIQYTLNTIPLL